MPTYLPFAGKNAIAEMLVGVQFEIPFDTKIGASADAIKAEFQSDFPMFSPVKTFTFNLIASPVAVPAQNDPSNISGFNLVKNKSDGTPARIINVMSNMISVQFFEYSSWKEAKPRAIDYIVRSLKHLAVLERNRAVGVLLRYTDRFTFDGVPDEASAKMLFRPETKFVSPRIFDAGSQWHCNSGWFEMLCAGKALVLNQLNTSSISGAVAIEHACVHNFTQPRKSIEQLVQQSAMHPSLEVILDAQHNANADLLKDLLNQQMLNTIGLGENKR